MTSAKLPPRRGSFYAFLREVFLANDRREVSWPLYRWDYWRWHINEKSISGASAQLTRSAHPRTIGEALRKLIVEQRIIKVD